MSFTQPTNEVAAIASDERAKIDGSKGQASRYDPLADMVVRRWWDAATYMQSELLQKCPIQTTIEQCFRQRNNRYDPEDIALLDGIDVYVPLTDMKCTAAEAWMRDMLMNAIDMPWTVEPTPIPDLPERLKMRVLRDLKLEIVAAQSPTDPVSVVRGLAQMPGTMADMAFGQMVADYPGDIEDLASRLKAAAKSLAFAEASRAANGMHRLMLDQCVQMRFAATLLMFISDLATYPSAILKGPVLATDPRIKWSGNRRIVDQSPYPTVFRVSPFDFKPSPDSPDTQRGSYVLERTRMTRRTLMEARGKRFWIKENIDAILSEYQNYNRNWLMFDTNGNLEQAQYVNTLWSNAETIDCVEHHGIVSGNELRQYGFSVDDMEFFETKVVVCGARTICVRVNGEPLVAKRPYHSTSYEKLGERFWNICPPMKLRDTQRAANAAIRAQIRNMAFSSGPIGEVDVARMQRFVKELADLQNVTPYSMALVDPDLTNGGRPARTFYNVPNIIAPLTQTLNYYFKMADDVSNIPNYAQGDTGLSGAGRTYRGFSAVFSQALKVFKMPIQNMDFDIFEPFASALYDYNMTTSDDDAIKGDAKVRARGSQGLVDKEQAEQKTMEVLQAVSQISPAAAEVAPDEARRVLKYTWARAMQALGVPIELFGINPEAEAALGAQQARTSVMQSPEPATPIPPVPGAEQSVG